MAKGARVVRKSAPARSVSRWDIGWPRTDQRGDERLRKRTKVLRGNIEAGSKRRIRAGSEASTTQAEQEVTSDVECVTVYKAFTTHARNFANPFQRLTNERKLRRKRNIVKSIMAHCWPVFGTADRCGCDRISDQIAGMPA